MASNRTPIEDDVSNRQQSTPSSTTHQADECPGPRGRDDERLDRRAACFNGAAAF